MIYWGLVFQMVLVALANSFVLAAGTFILCKDDNETDPLSFLGLWMILFFAIMPSGYGGSGLFEVFNGIVWLVMKVFLIMRFVHLKMMKRKSVSLLIAVYVILFEGISTLFVGGLNRAITIMVSDLNHMVIADLNLKVFDNVFIYLPTDTLISFAISILLVWGVRKKVREIIDEGMDIPIESFIPLFVMLVTMPSLKSIVYLSSAYPFFYSKPASVLTFIYLFIPVSFIFVFKQGLLAKRLEEKERHAKLAMKLYQEQMHALIRDKDKLAERHVFIEKLKTVKAMLDHKEGSAAIIAIQQILDVADNGLAGLVSYTGNQYVNLVLNYIHKQEKMEFHVVSTIGDDCGVDPIDLGILLLNMIYARLQEVPETEKMEFSLKRMEYALIMHFHDKILYDDTSSAEYAIVQNKIEAYDGFLDYDKLGGTIITLYLDGKDVKKGEEK